MFRVLVAALVPLAALEAQSLIGTVAGTDWLFPAAALPGPQAPLGQVFASAIDGNSLLLADQDNHTIFRLDLNGRISVVAGNGLKGFSGDGGSARDASLDSPRGVAVDAAGNIYISDTENHRIRRVSTDGRITTIAGTGFSGFSGDGGDARQARLNSPRALTLDSAGNLYVADRGNARIRRIAPGGIITTVAGNGTRNSTGDGGPALSAAVDPDLGLAVDGQGRILFSEFNYHRIRAVDRSGSIRSIAGTGVAGAGRNGAPASESPLEGPAGLVVDSRGNLYIAETNNYRILQIGPDGILRVAAGNGSFGILADGQGALQTPLGFPYAVGVGEGGRILFSDSVCACIGSFQMGGQLRSVAGNGRFGRINDGVSALRAFLFEPRGLAFDRSGNLIVANSAANRLDRISPDGIYVHLAGRAEGCCNDNGPATNALISTPVGVAVDSQNRIYFSQIGFALIRRIDTNGTITTFAGNRQRDFRGDNGPATQASFNGPVGIAFDASDNLYVADRTNRRIRRITPAGIVTTVAGDGQNRYFGDGGPALQAGLRDPYAVAVMPNGDVLVADVSDNRIRRFTPGGTISTFAGNGRNASSGDDGPATQASLSAPAGLAVDANGNVYVLDNGTHTVRRIDTSGIITTIAGNGRLGYSGDGGLSTAASLNSPQMGLAIRPGGDLVIADTDNNRVRVIRNEAPTLTTSRRSITFQGLPGQSVPSARFEVRSSVRGLLYEVSTRSEGGDWLRISTRQSSAPSDVQLEVDTSQLTPGRYAAVVTVSSPVSEPRSVNVPVVLTVPEPQGDSVLSVSSSGLTFSVDAGASDERSFTVTSEGLPVSVAVEASVDGGGDWLRVSPGQVTASSRPENVSVAVSAQGLRAGTYTGLVQLRAGIQTQRVPVRMVVKAAPRGRILISQTGLSFTGVAGGGVPAPQTIGVLNAGSGDLSWNATVSTLSGGDWLRIDTRSGRVERPLLDVSFMNVQIDQRGLGAGEYYGRVEVTSAAENSPQTVTVILRVLPEGSTPPPDVRPTGLVFTALQGTNPGSQNVTITNLLDSTVPLSANGFTADGVQWFNQTPSNGAVEPNSPGRMVVQPNLRTLEPGIRRGAITLLFPSDGSIRTVSVLSVVAPPGTLGDASKGERGLLGCPQRNLLIEITSVRNDFVAFVGQPLNVEARIVDRCGNPLTPQNGGSGMSVVASLTGEGQTNLVHLGNGVWTGTIRPTKPNTSTVFLGVYTNVGGVLDLAERTGTVQVVSRTPVVLAGSLRHSATFDTDVPVAPGQLISVLGGNLADGEGISNTLPLPRELNQTEVLLGGRALPLLYTSDGQINAQVPYDLPVNTQQQLLVRRGNTLSVPEQFVVADAQPGIFTKNERGFGQGTITKTDGSTFAEPATPAQRGEEVIIFCTGLGQVTPALEPGQAAPDPAPRVVAEVQVTIGGRPAEVRFAGLTPGTAGRYQVRVVVPGDAPTGEEVPVVVTAAGRSSQTVTMAIR
ncbi:MAG: hypothetical protein JNL98_12985 [Bryobacterales bacterium]|nr:hypothetical protein [Bryobacterales bacterium]